MVIAEDVIDQPEPVATEPEGEAEPVITVAAAQGKLRDAKHALRSLERAVDRESLRLATDASDDLTAVLAARAALADGRARVEVFEASVELATAAEERAEATARLRERKSELASFRSHISAAKAQLAEFTVIAEAARLQLDVVRTTLGQALTVAPIKSPFNSVLNEAISLRLPGNHTHIVGDKITSVPQPTLAEQFDAAAKQAVEMAVELLGLPLAPPPWQPPQPAHTPKLSPLAKQQDRNASAYANQGVA